jgi:hypothetical protein
MPLYKADGIIFHKKEEEQTLFIFLFFDLRKVLNKAFLRMFLTQSIS